MINYSKDNKSVPVQRHQSQGVFPDRPEKEPKFFGGDYVDLAEKYMKENKGSKDFRNLSTTKVRSFLTLINSLYNALLLEKTTDSEGRISDELNEDQLEQLRNIKVRMIFETRDHSVKVFLNNTGLIDGLNFIGRSKKKFIRYTRYLEALVAYHRFYGGQD